MSKRITFWGAIIMVCLTVGNLKGETIPVNQEEFNQWLLHLLPLPHHIAITEKTTLAPSEVGIQLTTGSGEIEQHAIEEFKNFFKQKTGIEPTGDKFKILCGVLDKDNRVCGFKVNRAEELKKLPNKEQAYLMQPFGNDKLIIAALDPKGIYYGIVTLKQLLGKNITREIVSIPMAKILDWPDLKYRGSWCISLDNQSIIWESSLKLNFNDWLPVTYILSGRNAGSPSWKDWKIRINRGNINCGKLHAFTRFVREAHFNFPQWHRRLEKFYPELLGKGKNAWQAAKGLPYGPPRQFQCPCASNPLFEDLLASLMEASARAGIDHVMFWTTEYFGHCECENCKDKNQYVLETRALINAWKRVRKKYPDFSIALFYSFRKNDGSKRPSPDTGDKVVTELLNSDVKTIVRACYSIDQDGENPPFDTLAENDKVLISQHLPSLCNRELCSSLKNYQKRIDHLLRAKWQGGAAFTILRDKEINAQNYNAFRLAAIAEWGWNNKGRNLSQFAEAWATINDYKQPAKFARFILLLEPIAGKTIGRKLNFSQQKTYFKNALDGKEWLFPVKTKEKNLNRCQEALKLAEEIGALQWILDAETALAFLEVNYAAGEIITAARNKDNDKLKIAAAEFKAAATKMNNVINKRKELYGTTSPNFAHHDNIMKKNFDAFEKEVNKSLKQ